MELKFLVVGTGRCGTVFMARLLTSLGIPCGHEFIFGPEGLELAIERLKGRASSKLSICSTHDCLKNNEDIFKWVDVEKIVAESSYMAAPFLNHSLIKDVPVIHVVRNPLNVIRSYVKDAGFFAGSGPSKEMNKRSWEQFIYHHFPEMCDMDNATERACHFYVKWNEMIEDKILSERRYLRCKIENQLSDELTDFIGRKKSTFFTNKRINSWNNKENVVGLDEVSSDVKRIMERYEYSTKAYL